MKEPTNIFRGESVSGNGKPPGKVFSTFGREDTPTQRSVEKDKLVVMGTTAVAGF